LIVPGLAIASGAPASAVICVEKASAAAVALCSGSEVVNRSKRLSAASKACSSSSASV
jgi:siroheme synthase